MWFAEPRLRWRLVAGAVVIPFLWFAPEYWGSGDWMRASSRANNPNPGSAAYADHPALELLARFRKVVIAPVKGGILLAAIYAFVQWLRHRREGATLAVAIGGFAWFALVAGMTEAGYAGNQRYLIISTAACCVLGGIGAARVLQAVGRLVEGMTGNWRTGAAAAAGFFAVATAVSFPFIVEKANNTERVSGGLDHEAELWADLKTMLDKVPRERLLACGGVFSGPFQTQMVAWQLHIHGIQIGWREKHPAGGGLPHAHRSRRAARHEADRRALPAGSPRGQVAHAGQCRPPARPPAPRRVRGTHRSAPSKFLGG